MVAKSTRSKSPSSVTDIVEPATESVGERTKSLTPEVSAVLAPPVSTKKGKVAKGLLFLAAALAVVAALVSSSSPVSIIGPSQCDACDSAVVISEGSASAMYYGVTFRLADSAAVEEFVASPDQFVPVSTKLTSLWSNPTYWTETQAAKVCVC